jgi:hypothetical protein
LVGPDGRPAGASLLLCPTCIAEGYLFNSQPVPTPAGRFELPGCDPDRGATAWFFDPQNDLGGVAQLSGRLGDERVVRLAACGSLTVRLAPGAGAKVTGPVRLELALVLRPPEAERPAQAPGPYPPVPAYVFRGSGYGTYDQADRNRVTFTRLLPGATYVLRANAGGGWVNLKELALRPGEKVDLGTIVFPPPDGGPDSVKT